MNIQLQPVAENSDRKLKRSLLKYMNKFRAGYFNKSAPEMSMQDLSHGFSKGEMFMLIVAEGKHIGAVEATPGSVGEQKLLSIATIYVDPRYRKHGVASRVYEYLNGLIDDVDITLQIEQSNYENNITKFSNMGFTHYWFGEVSSEDHRHYDEPTYLLFTKQYIPQLKPLAA